MAGVGFHEVCKTFTDETRTVVALDHLNLAVNDGELFSIVGPSGAGKTTALRILVGLADPAAGWVSLDGRDVTSLPVRRRNLGFVAQQRSLWPDRTVRANIAFPLELGRTTRRDGSTDEQVTAQAAELGVDHLLDRRVDELSDGHQRCVQLARSLISAPAALLLDEPLAFVDAPMRQRLRADIVRIHHQLGLTTVLVTADQRDACELSDRMAVLVDGHLHQVGAPADIVRAPLTASVAALVGEPGMNLLDITMGGNGDDRVAEILGLRIPVWSPLLDPYRGRKVTMGIRAQDLEPCGRDAPWSIEATVVSVATIDGRTDLAVETASGTRLRVSARSNAHGPGDRVRIAMRPERFHWFDPATGMAILHPPSG